MTQWGLDTIFNPAKRHMDEEKRRLQSTREEVGDNSGGKRIDLESGKVRIAPTEAADTERAETRAASSAKDDATSGSDPAGTSDPAGATAKPAAREAKRSDAPPTPAQIRAAARRGRTIG